MPSESLNVVIMFVDISGSTRLYEALGNEEAYRFVNTCVSALSDIIEAHQGTIIKTIGDEIMCTFVDADQAITAAMDMNKCFDNLFITPRKNQVKQSIRVGLHVGEVIKQCNDVFGDAVNVAARMVSLAKPKQIIITQETIDVLPDDSTIKYRLVDRTPIKGKKGEFNIYEVIWNQDDMTLMIHHDTGTPLSFHCLHLRYGEKEFYMDKDKHAVTLGRLPENDLVVDDGIASRFHARIEYNHGKFILIDQSSNGTYVFLDGEKPSLIHHDECVLRNCGFISLGCKAKAGSPGIIRFTCKK